MLQTVNSNQEVKLDSLMKGSKLLLSISLDNELNSSISFLIKRMKTDK